MNDLEKIDDLKQDLLTLIEDHYIQHIAWILSESNKKTEEENIEEACNLIENTLDKLCDDLIMSNKELYENIVNGK